jgi:hypothetical protein
VRWQSSGVSTLLHSAQTVVHLVTLLEEMPVQETLDAAAILAAEGYRPGHIIVNRARPDLVPAHVVGAGVTSADLIRIGLDGALAPELARQVVEYAQRQGVQATASERLDAAGLPVVTLPQLPAPMDLGSLFELAETLAPRSWDGHA